MLRDFRLQQPNEGGIHEFVVIRNVQADQPPALERGAVFGLNLAPVRFLHHEDDIGPFDLFCRERIFRIIVRAGRRRFDIRPACEHLFGSRAAQLVLAAYEQNVSHHFLFHLSVAEAVTLIDGASADCPTAAICTSASRSAVALLRI